MNYLSPETGFVLGLSVYLIFLATRCGFQVAEGHLAVLSTFGKVEFLDAARKQLLTHGPGMHWKWPWQKVHDVSLMEQMIDLSGETGGTTAMTSDGTMLRLDSKLRITPLKEDLYQYLFSLEHATEHVKGAFICLLRNEIANFDGRAMRQGGSAVDEAALLPALQVGSYAAMRQERRMLNRHIQEFCRERIGNRYGINFNGVDLTDILPPDELAQALNAVINAQSEAMRLYAQTEGECLQRVAAAQKGLAIAQAKAQATKEEIETMASLLGKLQETGTLRQYVERRRAEVFSESRACYMKG